MNTEIDADVTEWGERMFWPKNKVKGRFSNGEGSPFPRARPTPRQVRARVAEVMKRGPQVMVKITGGGTGMSKINSHFHYISRNGKLDLEDQDGNTLKGKDDLRQLSREWRTGLSEIPKEGTRREAYNVMFSMPANTNAELVHDAVRAVAAKEFKDHQFVFALHRPGEDDKTERPHVHLVVRKEGIDGSRLNPRKADLRRWREDFAQALQERGVAALATPRPIHGQLRRARKQLQKYADPQQQNDADRPLSDAEVRWHLNGVGMWGKLAEALSRSTLKDDRDMAVAMTQFVSRMPIVQFVKDPKPGRESPRSRYNGPQR